MPEFAGAVARTLPGARRHAGAPGGEGLITVRRTMQRDSFSRR